MAKTKLNYPQIMLIVFSFFIFVVIILSPSIYLNSVSNGIMVWATIILPGLIPFMFLSKILSSIPYTYSSCFVLNKLTKKCFSCPKETGYIYFMSILSGYPLGSKLIKDYYDNNVLSYDDCKKAVAFCSTSGPIFMIGSVGSSLIGNYTAGIIIFCAHILGSFLNGLLFKGRKTAGNYSSPIIEAKAQNVLNDSMYSTVISSLIVGGFIAFTFLLIDILQNFGALATIGELLNNTIFMGRLNAGNQVAAGLVEVTRGCLEISQSSLSIQAKTIICSALTAFGGASVHLQCMVFLSSIKIKYSYFLKTKLAHTVITAVLAYIMCLFMF